MLKRYLKHVTMVVMSAVYNYNVVSLMMDTIVELIQIIIQFVFQELSVVTVSGKERSNVILAILSIQCVNSVSLLTDTNAQKMLKGCRHAQENVVILLCKVIKFVILENIWGAVLVKISMLESLFLGPTNF